MGNDTESPIPFAPGGVVRIGGPLILCNIELRDTAFRPERPEDAAKVVISGCIMRRCDLSLLDGALITSNIFHDCLLPEREVVLIVERGNLIVPQREAADQ